MLVEMKWKDGDGVMLLDAMQAQKRVELGKVETDTKAEFTRKHVQQKKASWVVFIWANVAHSRPGVAIERRVISRGKTYNPIPIPSPMTNQWLPLCNNFLLSHRLEI